ncbi:hypothetical protein [Pumilibacter muris]|uniref:hypothetical protein n=1 Tax=Pumilibacter muris TaxID=2941510 RepID=UPI002041E6C9|nr:hypothetical protein [Pumilibacter muris]
MANTLRAGAITGSPTAGLCERMCIEVKRVFDGCKEVFNNQSYVLELAGIPPQATPPFTFVEAVNYGATAFENVSVSSLENGKARISGDVVVPILVTFTDANGNAYTATSSLRLHRDVVLSVPAPTIAPYTIEVFSAFVSRIGSFISNEAVSVSACLVLIIKVIVIADILVPTYGNCVYPECVDCGDICNEFLSLPLFP